jgi:hypothetical protein
MAPAGTGGAPGRRTERAGQPAGPSTPEIVIREDDDGRVSVCLEGPTANNGLAINSNKSLVWGRDKEEAERIARRIAEHLQLGLSIHREPGRPKLHI